MEVEVTMINWPLWQLVIALIGVFFVGALIGYFDSNNRSERKIREAQEKAEAAVHQAKGEAERAAARVAKAEQMAASIQSVPGKTLMRLWLNEKDVPAIDLDGQTVDTSQFSEHDRKRLIVLLNVMRPWIEGKPAAAAPPPPSAAAPAHKLSTLSAVTHPPQPTPATKPMPSSPVSMPASTPIAPVAKREEKPTAPLSMVGQIDEILQARLAAGPLADRGIKLIESPEGTVIVMVGSQQFNGVGEVTDAQIQAEIRAAIAEWEKKYTPGI